MKKKKQDKNIILTLSLKIAENEVNDKYIERIDNLLKIDDCKNIATNNFVNILEFSFRRNKWHNIGYNNAIYNGI